MSSPITCLSHVCHMSVHVNCHMLCHVFNTWHNSLKNVRITKSHLVNCVAECSCTQKLYHKVYNYRLNTNWPKLIKRSSEGLSRRKSYVAVVFSCICVASIPCLFTDKSKFPSRNQMEFYSLEAGQQTNPILAKFTHLLDQTQGSDLCFFLPRNPINWTTPINFGS